MFVRPGVHYRRVLKTAGKLELINCCSFKPSHSSEREQQCRISHELSEYMGPRREDGDGYIHEDFKSKLCISIRGSNIQRLRKVCFVTVVKMIRRNLKASCQAFKGLAKHVATTTIPHRVSCKLPPQK